MSGGLTQLNARCALTPIGATVWAVARLWDFLKTRALLAKTTLLAVDITFDLLNIASGIASVFNSFGSFTMKQSTTCILSAFLTLACAGSSTAELVYSPTLQNGDKFHLVFTTSGTIAATANDIGTYNAFVTAQADLAGLGTIFGQSVTWKAIASTAAVDAKDNIGNPASAIFNTQGQLVADDEADLWDGSIDHAIRGDQFGANVNGTTATGTLVTGVKSDSYPLGLASLFAAAGATTAANNTWIYGGVVQNAAAFNIYGISSEITYAVPEPTSLALLGLGGLMVMRRRRG